MRCDGRTKYNSRTRYDGQTRCDGQTQEYSDVFPDRHSDQYSQAGSLEILYRLTIWVRAVKDTSLRMVLLSKKMLATKDQD